MLGDSKKRIEQLERTVKEQEYHLNAHDNALKALLSMIEDLQKAPIETDKKDPSAKLRNKDGLLDSRIYFSKKMKEDEE